jgi:hypothetical protein
MRGQAGFEDEKVVHYRTVFNVHDEMGAKSSMRTIGACVLSQDHGAEVLVGFSWNGFLKTTVAD